MQRNQHDIMALLTDINDLLNKRKVESERIEFKKGWNPTAIYRSICAFANDIEDIGGGYILVGVEAVDGVPVRPVTGLSLTEIDNIQRKMIDFNNMFEPYYMPRPSVEEVDGKLILAIWVPSGVNRPYAIPSDVNAKLKKPTFYVRNGSSTIEAKGEVLEELRGLASHVPFDDRPNPDIKLDDLSSSLMRDFFVNIGSKLKDQDLSGNNMMEALEQMDMLDGPAERRYIKNIAAMMFCNHPEKFFPKTQVEIVFFPEGRERNPNNMFEAPVIHGSVPRMINDTLQYLRTIVIRQRIVKPKDDEHSIKSFNYPYQAIEEAVVNAFYHRDYREYAPIEITVEPDHITIFNLGGPDHSISMEAIRHAKSLRSRRYRNVRLGDCLKELGLTEGRATGIPTIQDELRANGSPLSTIETDEERSFFLIDLPCRVDMVENMALDKIIRYNDSYEAVDFIKDFTKDFIKENETELTERQKEILILLADDFTLTSQKISQKISQKKPVSMRTILKDLAELQQKGFLRREGGRKNGYWRLLFLPPQ